MDEEANEDHCHPVLNMSCDVCMTRLELVNPTGIMIEHTIDVFSRTHRHSEQEKITAHKRFLGEE